jgi:hypothetical protein
MIMKLIGRVVCMYELRGGHRNMYEDNVKTDFKEMV